MNRGALVGTMVMFAACGPPQTPAPAPAPAETVAEVAQVEEAPAAVFDPHNLIENFAFDTAAPHPWMAMTQGDAAAKGTVRDGAFCVDIEKPGVNAWDVLIVHRGLRIERGHAYRFRARIWSSVSGAISARARIGMSRPPHTEYWSRQIVLNTDRQLIEGEMYMNAESDPNGEVTFQLGGNLVTPEALPLTVCVDEVYLTDPQLTRKATEKPLPVSDIRVNQVGYLPGFRKTAVLVSDLKRPLPWKLVKGKEEICAGDTAVHGDDLASAQHLHLIDFSSCDAEGKGYRLRVGEDVSHPFPIAKGLFRKMRYDALAYFYHNRSGVPISMPYAGEERWTRPAGHVTDESVPCLPGSGCAYSLDVRGGWYDAGDHGKYVVNGGYSVWVLLNLYERGIHLGRSVEDFADGTMNIPERGNGVPDILDEARVELEFLLKMMVPDKAPLVGMVHHKIHDEDWSGIPTAPHEDPLKRFLHPPSTAATLHLAAVAAQASRIWKEIDSGFSKRCLKAAAKAYRAAREHPEMLASKERIGGGPYYDDYLEDELYWAAAELFITTGKFKYLSALEKSPHHLVMPTVDKVKGRELARAAMDWREVGGLGIISLAVVPNTLPKKVIDRLREVIVEGAEESVDVADREGYRLPLSSKPKPDYYWGSNFVVMNNLIVLALAYDFTQESGYADALVDGMGYLLGMNPMDQCYVTGYGTRPLRHPHHRFWAVQADPRFPPPPPGAISGGPNQHLEDPRVRAAIPGGTCAPAACFADHIDSYSTNEVAINGNAAFAWLTAYMDEVARFEESP